MLVACKQAVRKAPKRFGVWMLATVCPFRGCVLCVSGCSWANKVVVVKALWYMMGVLGRAEQFEKIACYSLWAFSGNIKASDVFLAWFHYFADWLWMCVITVGTYWMGQIFSSISGCTKHLNKPSKLFQHGLTDRQRKVLWVQEETSHLKDKAVGLQNHPLELCIYVSAMIEHTHTTCLRPRPQTPPHCTDPHPSRELIHNPPWQRERAECRI